MKALVLAGGRGTRLRPITHTRAKQLVPVANKPVLYYGLEAIAAAGIREVGIIVSDPRELLQPDHRTGELVTTLVNSQAEIRAAVGDGAAFGLQVTYIEQEAPLGLAHAVKISEDFMAGDSFVMYLGDNLIKDGIVPFVQEFEREKPEAQILLAKVARPWEFGVAELEGDRVVRLEEKPKQPRSDLALVGVYLFTKSIFDAVRAIQPSPRGELEITDAIQHLIATKRNVRSHVIHGWWKDTGRVEDLLEANRIVLTDMTSCIEGTVDAETVIEGPVRIGKGTKVERSRLRGPLVIGEGAHISDAYVGPFSAIADGVRIEKCEVEHSIVLDRSELRAIHGRIESSLIGRDVVVVASDARPSAHRLMLGDSSRGGVGLSKVVVTGAAGMLAQEVVPGLRAFGHAVVPLTDLDVTQAEDVRKAIVGAKPDWVFHLAAYTDVDGCEARPEHAMQVNGAGAGHVAAAAAEAGAAVLAMSSDYVFPGDDPRPRGVDDPTGPISAYGRSKLAGEEAVRAANPRHLIVRTAWLYGRGGRNFVDTIRSRALAGEPLAVVADQRGAPTWTHDLAGAMAELIERQVTGTFHITNSGDCTWHDFAVEICRLAGADVPVKRTSSADLARAAKRPAYSVLDLARFEQVMGFPMAGWRDALARYFEQMASVTQGQGGTR